MKVHNVGIFLGPQIHRVFYAPFLQFYTSLVFKPYPIFFNEKTLGNQVFSQADHSGEPLGDPSARVFEVFLIVLDGNRYRGTKDRASGS